MDSRPALKRGVLFGLERIIANKLVDVVKSEGDREQQTQVDRGHGNGLGPSPGVEEGEVSLLKSPFITSIVFREVRHSHST
jgi:hypothetical protein